MSSDNAQPRTLTLAEYPEGSVAELLEATAAFLDIGMNGVHLLSLLEHRPPPFNITEHDIEDDLRRATAWPERC